MTATLEQQKQLYAKQLAAYTLRQWNAVRRHDAERNEKPPPSTSAEPLRDERENQSVTSGDRENSPSDQTTPGGKQRSNGNRRGILVVDFGSRRLSPKHHCPSERRTGEQH